MSGEHKASSVKGRLLAWIRGAQKAITAGVGIVSGIAAMGILPQPHATYVATAIAIATAVLTYVIPNVEQIVQDYVPDPAGVTVEQILAEQANPAPVEPAEAVESTTPTSDTPEPIGVDTAAMSIEDVLAELHA